MKLRREVSRITYQSTATCFASSFAYQGLKKLEPPILMEINTEVSVITASQNKADPAMDAVLTIIRDIA